MGRIVKSFTKIYLSITKVSQNKSDKHSEMITDGISSMQSRNYIVSSRCVKGLVRSPSCSESFLNT